MRLSSGFAVIVLILSYFLCNLLVFSLLIISGILINLSREHGQDSRPESRAQQQVEITFNGFSLRY